MRGLFELLYRFRAFLLFVVLELGCVWLIVRHNRFQQTAFLSSSNQVAARLTASSGSVQSYFLLTETNEALAHENARLSELLDQERRRAQMGIPGDTVRPDSLTPFLPTSPQYRYRVARVINNSVARFDNYLTLDKGRADGLAPGMGIISAEGVVGRVQACSENYATATSVLHSAASVSARIRRSGAFGSLKWDGRDPRLANLLYIPRHVLPQVGDTVVTSGYSSLFPEDIMVGIVQRVDIRDNDTFYDIDIALSTNFNTLTYVYVIENTRSEEYDSLQAATDPSFNLRNP